MINLLNVMPLLVFPLWLYNLVVLTGIAPAGAVGAWMSDPIFVVMMFSGDPWSVSFSDIFLGLVALLFFVEIVKATRSDALSIVSHGLSMTVFLICLLQLLTLKGFATTPFLMLTVLSLLDVITGYVVTIVAAQRDFDRA